MGLIQDYIRRLREKKAQREGFESEQHMVEGFEQKKLTANERELMRYQEEERQKRIKFMLERKRKQENNRVWRGQQANPVYTKNVIAGHKKLFGETNMFAGVPNVVTQPNLFNRKDLFFKGGV